ncbi:MAG: hypothetical protein Q9168_000426 [Polycauliona sp. 1 TL-2023]
MGPDLGDLSVLARASLRMVRDGNQDSEIRQARVLADVATTMNPWREPPVSEGMTTAELVAMIGRNINDDRQNIEHARDSLNDLFAPQANLPQQQQPPPPPAPAPPMVNGWHLAPARAGPRPQALRGSGAGGRGFQYQVSSSL